MYCRFLFTRLSFCLQDCRSLQNCRLRTCIAVDPLPEHINNMAAPTPEMIARRTVARDASTMIHTAVPSDTVLPFIEQVGRLMTAHPQMTQVENIKEQMLDLLMLGLMHCRVEDDGPFDHLCVSLLTELRDRPKLSMSVRAVGHLVPLISKVTESSHVRDSVVTSICNCLEWVIESNNELLWMTSGGCALMARIIVLAKGIIHSDPSVSPNMSLQSCVRLLTMALHVLFRSRAYLYDDDIGSVAFRLLGTLRLLPAGMDSAALAHNVLVLMTMATPPVYDLVADSVFTFIELPTAASIPVFVTADATYVYPYLTVSYSQSIDPSMMALACFLRCVRNGYVMTHVQRDRLRSVVDVIASTFVEYELGSLYMSLVNVLAVDVQ